MPYVQVVCAATSNVSINAAPSSFDGVGSPALVSGASLILLLGQTTASQTSIWVWNGNNNPL